ncbi:hypothetical protein HK098_006831, partial [Nowakowskiella sp. JEL0407]
MGGNLSRSAPPQRPLTSMDVVAIDPRYCVSLPTTLHISEAQKLMNNDTITVINATTGIQHFLVESRMFSIRDEETYIYIEGKEWKKKFADVCFGSKTGPVIGQIRRRLGEGGGEIHTGVFTTVLDYFLVVAPGVDAAFLVAFCLALDE